MTSGNFCHKCHIYIYYKSGIYSLPFSLGPALISKNIDVTQQEVVDQIMLDVRINYK